MPPIASTASSFPYILPLYPLSIGRRFLPYIVPPPLYFCTVVCLMSRSTIVETAIRGLFFTFFAWSCSVFLFFPAPVAKVVTSLKHPLIFRRIGGCTCVFCRRTATGVFSDQPFLVTGVHEVPVNAPDRLFAELLTVAGFATDVLLTDEVLRNHSSLTAVTVGDRYPKSQGGGASGLAQEDKQAIGGCCGKGDGVDRGVSAAQADIPPALALALSVLNTYALPHRVNPKYARKCIWTAEVREHSGNDRCECDDEDAPPGWLPAETVIHDTSVPPFLFVNGSAGYMTVQDYVVALIHLVSHLGPECYNHDERWRERVMVVTEWCCIVNNGLPVMDGEITRWGAYLGNAQFDENEWAGRTVSVREYGPSDDVATLGIYDATGKDVVIELNYSVLDTYTDDPDGRQLLRWLVFFHELVHVLYPYHLHGPVFRRCLDLLCSTCLRPRTDDSSIAPSCGRRPMPRRRSSASTPKPGGKCAPVRTRAADEDLTETRALRVDGQSMDTWPEFSPPLACSKTVGSLVHAYGEYLGRHYAESNATQRSTMGLLGNLQLSTSEGQLRYLAVLFPLLVTRLSDTDMWKLRRYIGSRPDNVNLIPHKPGPTFGAARVTMPWTMDARIADTALGNLFPHIRVYCVLKGGAKSTAMLKRLELECKHEVCWSSDCDRKYLDMMTAARSCTSTVWIAIEVITYEKGTIKGFPNRETANKSISHLAMVQFRGGSGTYVDHALTVGDYNDYVNTRYVPHPTAPGIRYIHGDGMTERPTWAMGKDYKTYENVIEIRVMRHVFRMFSERNVHLHHTNSVSLMGNDRSNVCFSSVVVDLMICHAPRMLCAGRHDGVERAGNSRDESEDDRRNQFVDGWGSTFHSPKEATKSAMVATAALHLDHLHDSCLVDARAWTAHRCLSWGAFDGVCDVCGCKDYDNVPLPAVPQTRADPVYNELLLCQRDGCQCAVHTVCQTRAMHGIFAPVVLGDRAWWCRRCADVDKDASKPVDRNDASREEDTSAVTSSHVDPFMAMLIEKQQLQVSQ